MNLAFYVSRKATRLNKILQDNNLELLKSIKLVFSDDESTLYLKDKLEELGIEYVLYDYKKIIVSNGKKKNSILSDKMLEVFKFYEIDYCFCFGSHILEGDLLKEYSNKIINFHPSLLPAFPGRKAIDQAIEANVKILGNTAHFIDSGVDTGPIIMQSVMSSKIFELEGYDGILDKQIPMLYSIFNALKNNNIEIQGNKVNILDRKYNQVSYFPNI